MENNGHKRWSQTSQWCYNQLLAQIATVLMSIDMEDPQKENLVTDA
jgi:hypothetical protein